MKKEKNIIAIVVMNLCLLGICLFMNPTVTHGQMIAVHDVVNPRDIPAIAVELNEENNVITQKLSEVSYIVYTDSETLHIPVSWNISSVNMKIAGVYTIKGMLKLPEGYDMGDVQSPQVQTTVSVQYPEKPDINTYYRLTAAGLYIFPWIEREDTEDMEVYLKKDNGNWLNLTEEGFAVCYEDGLYVSNQSMVAGNTYSILVTYDNGRKQTGTLRFLYRKDGSLNIYSYRYSQIENVQKPAKYIHSYDTKDEKYLSRCAAYAVKTGTSLKKIEDELTESIKLRVSTAQKFENTAENPEIILESSWDIRQADTAKPGVYKLTGTFVIPEGYEIADDLTLPKAYAYISVQKKGEPQIDTYSMPAVDLLEFPMLTEGFSTEELQNMQVYIRENKGSYQKVDKELAEVRSQGVQLYFREILKKGRNYDICVVYEKGSTGIYSFQYNDAFIVNEYWHERNFSDRDEKNLPDIVQKAPKLESEITPTPVGEEAESPKLPETEETYYGNGAYHSAASGSGGTGNTTAGTGSAVKTEEAEENTVTELSTDTVTAVSGQRLLLMVQQNGCAKFEKQGISVTVSSDTVNAWKVSENDEIQVRIEKTAEAAFSLRIFVRGEEMTEIPGTVVEIPVSVFGEISSWETAVVEDTQGNQCTEEYLEKQNLLHIQIDKTGDYFISDTQMPDGVESAAGQTAVSQTGSFGLQVAPEETGDEAAETVSDMNDTGESQEAGEAEEQGKSRTENHWTKTEKILPGFVAGAVILAVILIVRKKRRLRDRK